MGKGRDRKLSYPIFVNEEEDGTNDGAMRYKTQKNEEEELFISKYFARFKR